jgi:hypothetical protein
MTWPANILPVPIRGNECAFLANIPWDLTPAEALRIAAVIEAGALDEPLRPSPKKITNEYARGYKDGLRRGRKLPLPLTAPNERK